MWPSISPTKNLFLFLFLFDLEITQQKNISIASMYGELFINLMPKSSHYKYYWKFLLLLTKYGVHSIVYVTWIFRIWFYIILNYESKWRSEIYSLI